jgi:hypothetical protein
MSIFEATCGRFTLRNRKCQHNKRLHPTIASVTSCADAQAAVYANRRRMRGKRGRRLMRQRGERIERTFAHCYETGGMRRVHLRGHPNILKRLLVHGAGYNLALVMWKLCGTGVPRAWANLARAMKRSIRGICQLIGRIIQSGIAASRYRSRKSNIVCNRHCHAWVADA